MYAVISTPKASTALLTPHRMPQPIIVVSLAFCSACYIKWIKSGSVQRALRQGASEQAEQVVERAGRISSGDLVIWSRDRQ